jgi:hypothetical protein
MGDRKWALVNGKFKVLSLDEAVEVEITPEFKVRVDEIRDLK